MVWGLWFGVWGLGLGVWGLGFGVWGLGFVLRDETCLCINCRGLPPTVRGEIWGSSLILAGHQIKRLGFRDTKV